MECSTCHEQHDRAGQRNCKKCHAAYMREWRKANPPSEEQRRKGICRSYTKVLVTRGHLLKQPCSICRSAEVEAHHPDYGRPRLVIWLCKQDHRLIHQALADKATMITT